MAFYTAVPATRSLKGPMDYIECKKFEKRARDQGYPFYTYEFPDGLSDAECTRRVKSDLEEKIGLAKGTRRVHHERVGTQMEEKVSEETS